MLKTTSKRFSEPLKPPKKNQWPPCKTSNCCKSALEDAKLTHACKTKESISSKELGSLDNWRIANGVLNKGESTIAPYVLTSSLEVLSSASDKAFVF